MESFTSTQRSSLNRLTLLYVEDDLKIQNSTSRLLKRLFKKLYLASDGEEGLEIYKHHHPDIVLTDVQMPKMDGLSMSRNIHSIDPDTPIIITSAYHDSEYLLEAIKNKIHHYLLKPIEYDDLKQALLEVSEKIILKRELKESLHILNEYKEAVDTSALLTKTDAQGIITYTNDAFCTASGYAHDELLGKDHSIFRHPDTPIETFQSLWANITKKVRWRGIVRNLAKDGSDFISDTTIIPVLDTDGDIIEIIAIRYNLTEHKMSQERMERRADYNNYQEELAFRKQLNIIRNDYYYKLDDEEITDNTCLIDSYYRPLDIMSGDSYSIRRLGGDVNFFLVVDGMGKGLSASLSAMLFSTYINHLIDESLQYKKPLTLRTITERAIAYIKPILLEDEVLSAHLIRADTKKEFFEHASFAMPAILTLDYKGEVNKIPSNNPPISKYGNTVKIDGASNKDIRQTLLYSDGLVENSVKDSDELYMSHIEEDFAKALTRDDMHQAIQERLGPQEDDITFIYLSKLEFEKYHIASRRVSCSILALGEADEWYTQQLTRHYHDQEFLDHAGYAFTELMLNAYEHGNLGITGKQKHRMIEEGEYWDILPQKEQRCFKETLVDLYDIHHLDHRYLITMITDEGEGFDTAIFRDIFYRANNFNGRGVFISKRSTNGIYYNAKGNTVFTIKKTRK